MRITLYECFTPVWALGASVLVLPIVGCMHGIVTGHDRFEGAALCTFVFGTVAPLLVFSWILCWFVESSGTEVTVDSVFLPLYIWLATLGAVTCVLGVGVHSPYPLYITSHPEREFQQRMWHRRQMKLERKAAKLQVSSTSSKHARRKGFGATTTSPSPSPSPSTAVGVAAILGARRSAIVPQAFGASLLLDLAQEQAADDGGEMGGAQAGQVGEGPGGLPFSPRHGAMAAAV
jgi:hypothetical protein